MDIFSVWLLLIPVLMLIAIPIFWEIGRLIGKWRVRKSGVDEIQGSGNLESAMFALLGLLIGFTFFGAAERFENRRHMIVDEANIIGTAYLRVDLLPEDRQPLIREKFKQYLDSRIATYEKVPDMAAVNAELEHSLKLQNEIWKESIDASKASPWTPAGMLLINALNEMIDIVTTRTMSTQMHPPNIIFGMLIAMVLLCSLVAGLSTADKPRRGWLHIVVYSIVLSFSIYVIVDIEYPRLGFIRVDSFDKVLVDLRKSWDQ